MIAASKLSCVQQLAIPTAELPKPVPQPMNWGLFPAKPVAQRLLYGPGAVLGDPPNSGATVNAFGLRIDSPFPTRVSMLPGALRLIPDWQTPWELQCTGSASSARSTGPVAGTEAPYRRVASLLLSASVMLKGRPSWIVVTPETPHPPKAFPFHPSLL